MRGFNEAGKWLGVWNLLRGWRADLVRLQETKWEVVSRTVLNSLWGDRMWGISLQGHQGL